MGSHEDMLTGVPPVRLAKGLIHLIINEGGDGLKVQQWRPITLLGTTYKILAKETPASPL